MRCVLVVSEDRELRRLLTESIRDEHRIVRCCDSSHGASALEAGRDPDMIVLDAPIPSRSGYDMLADVQQRCAAPVLVLTSLADPLETAVVLECGAADCALRSTSPRVIAARVGAVLRRTPERHYGPPDRGSDWLGIDERARRVASAGGEVVLPRGDMAVLAYLAARPGEACSLNAIAEAVWGRAGSDREVRAVRSRVTRIRQRLESAGPCAFAIETVRGYGYRLAVRQPSRGSRGDALRTSGRKGLVDKLAPRLEARRDEAQKPSHQLEEALRRAASA